MSILRSFVRTLAFALVLVSVGTAAPVHAQFPGVEEYAEAISAMTSIWEGQRVPGPLPNARPDLPRALESLDAPIAVHADASVSAPRVRALLASLERAHLLLHATGWAAPMPDGGVGGSGAIDFYLSRNGERSFEARADGLVPWALFDTASGFAVIDPRVRDEDLDACATAAYAELGLLGQDPAESASWRRATAGYVAFLATGRFCDDEQVARHQAEPWRAWFDAPVTELGGPCIAGQTAGTCPREPVDGVGGALLAGLVSSRVDGGSGTQLRELWQFARQRTVGGGDPRGSPDLWEVVNQAQQFEHRRFEELAADLAVARYFTGTRDAGARYRVLRGLGADADVPVTRVAWAVLPEHLPIAEQPLETLGSAYVLLETHGQPAGTTVRVWLRGEFGVRWSLAVVRLDAQGREQSRMVAPSREQTPRSYLPVELDPGTEALLVVVTNVSHRIPDADAPDENARTFKLILASGAGPAEP